MLCSSGPFYLQQLPVRASSPFNREISVSCLPESEKANMLIYLVLLAEARVSEVALSSVSGASRPSPDPRESSRLPGLTTQPVIDQPQEPRKSIITIPRARKLGNVELTVEEIDELYLM